MSILRSINPTTGYMQDFPLHADKPVLLGTLSLHRVRKNLDSILGHVPAMFKKRIRELSGSSLDSEEGQIRDEMEKAFLRASIQDEYERKHLRRKIKKACQKRITVEEVFEDLYFDYFGERRPHELDAHETVRLERLKDLFQAFAESH